MNDHRVTRREALRRIGLGAASLALAASTGQSARGLNRPQRPNLLFLFTDDQRFSGLHALGNPAIETPNMDRLVAGGTAFTHAFIQGSTSGAVCICSRACLITGRGLFHAPTTPREADNLALWPATFRENGYVTFGTGKWHNGPWSYAQSFSRGADIFFGGMSNHLKVPVCDFDPTGKYPREARHIATQFSSGLFSDAAIRFLRQHDGPDPFFAYVSYTAPHDPRMAPREYADRYPPERITIPPNFLPEHPFDNGEMRIRDEQLAPWPRTPEVVREHIAAYYAMITHLDAQIGRVLAALEETGRAADTIVVLAGDNGLAVGQHGLMGKQNLYEHSVRVPLVMRGPGIPPARRHDSLVYLHDLFPTTCELAGLAIPETVESLSLAPLLAGDKPRLRETIFAAYKRVQRMVRDERHKLIVYPFAERRQLFDLAEDPWETTDLSADPAQRGTIARLSEAMKAWQQREGDSLDLDHPSKWSSAGVPVRPRADGSYVLRPQDAATTGNLRYQADRQNLGGWVNPADYPSWRLLDVRPGRYAIEFAYGSTNPGVEYAIEAGGQRVRGTTVNTGGLKTYQAFEVGAIELPAGPVTLAIRPGKFTGAIMNFRLLTLRPVAD